MDYLEYEVLKNRKGDFSEEEKEQCFQLLEELIKLSLIRKRSGLLAMEEQAHKNELKKGSQVAEFYRDAIIHVVDGNDTKDLALYLSNDLVFYGAKSFRGYLCYLIMKGMLSIRSGDSKSTTQEILKHCLPFSMREEAKERMEKAAGEYQEPMPEFRPPEIENWLPKRTKNPFLKKALSRLGDLSDEELEQFVNRAKMDEMLVLLDYSPASLRKRLLKYASETVKEKCCEENEDYSTEELSKLFCSVMASLKK